MSGYRSLNSDSSSGANKSSAVAPPPETLFIYFLARGAPLLLPWDILSEESLLEEELIWLGAAELYVLGESIGLLSFCSFSLFSSLYLSFIASWSLICFLSASSKIFLKSSWGFLTIEWCVIRILIPFLLPPTSYLPSSIFKISVTYLYLVFGSSLTR